MRKNIEKLKAYPNWNSTEKNILDKVVSKLTVIYNSEQSNNVSSKI